MDNKAQILREYNELLTERNRLKDYIKLVINDYGAYILAKMEFDDIELEIAQVGVRLEKLNWLDEVILDLD